MSAWTLTVKELQGQTMSIQVSNPQSASVLDLKRLITQQDPTIPTYQQRLVIQLADGGRTELDDSRTLSSYSDVQDCSQIALIRTLPFQIFVKGMDGKSHCIVVPSKTPQSYSVSNFKRLLQDRTGLRPEEQRLQFAGKELVDRMTLGDYNLVSNNTLHLVSRLRGGLAAVSVQTGYCVASNRYTTTYSMSCGHFVSTTGLYEHCMAKVRSGKDKVTCPTCCRGWSSKELKERGNLSESQLRAIDEGLTQNFALSMPGVIKCRRCGSVWATSGGSASSSGGDLCASCAVRNHDGKQATIELLAKCPVKTVDHSLDCPRLRACPSCGNVIEHESACRRVECKRCQTQFCFICLRIRPSNYDNYYPCAGKCGTASRQSYIPG